MSRNGLGLLLLHPPATIGYLSLASPDAAAILDQSFSECLVCNLLPFRWCCNGGVLAGGCCLLLLLSICRVKSEFKGPELLFQSAPAFGV